MFIRATILRQIGVFDDKFFMYVEDVDLSLRLTKKGSMYLVPDSVIFHYAHATAKKNSEKVFRNPDSYLNPNLCFYLSHVLGGYLYLVKKHNPKSTDQIKFYCYFYLRWLKKAVVFLAHGKIKAFRKISRILLTKSKYESTISS